ncbi:hypothetical protein HDV00_004022 [Rhizophlyctis rosea]|nr:hypothetical protein HDV00_004022 [Rhizophlyctis rosea]
MFSKETQEELVKNYGQALAEKSQLETQLALGRAVNDNLTEENRLMKESLAAKEAEWERLKEDRDMLTEQLNWSTDRLKETEQNAQELEIPLDVPGSESAEVGPEEVGLDVGDVSDASSESLRGRIRALARQHSLIKIVALVVMMNNGSDAPGMTISQVDSAAEERFDLKIGSQRYLSDLTADKLLKRARRGHYQLDPKYEGDKFFGYRDFETLRPLHMLALRHNFKKQEVINAGNEAPSGAVTLAAPRAEVGSSQATGIIVRLMPVSDNPFNHRALFTALGSSLRDVLSKDVPYDEPISAEIRKRLKNLQPSILCDYVYLSYRKRIQDLPQQYRQIVPDPNNNRPLDHRQLSDLAAKALNDRSVNVKTSGESAYILIGIICERFNRPCHLIRWKEGELRYACITRPPTWEDYRREDRRLDSTEVVRHGLGKAEQFILLADGKCRRFATITVNSKRLLDEGDVTLGIEAILHEYQQGWEVFKHRLIDQPVPCKEFTKDGAVETSVSQLALVTTPNAKTDALPQKRTRIAETADEDQLKRLHQSKPAGHKLHIRERTTLNKRPLSESEFKKELQIFHNVQSRLFTLPPHPKPISSNHATILDAVHHLGMSAPNGEVSLSSVQQYLRGIEYNPLRVCWNEMDGDCKRVYCTMDVDLGKAVGQDCSQMIRGGLLDWDEKKLTYHLPKILAERLGEGGVDRALRSFKLW